MVWYLSCPRLIPTTSGVLKVRRRKRGRQEGRGEGKLGRRRRRVGLKVGELGGSCWHPGISHVSISLGVHLKKERTEHLSERWIIRIGILAKHICQKDFLPQIEENQPLFFRIIVLTVSKGWSDCYSMFEDGIFEGKLAQHESGGKIVWQGVRWSDSDQRPNAYCNVTWRKSQNHLRTGIGWTFVR